ncbi:hypothetical protein F5Y16DRAFT_398621 [Xylariaceae sp. FL0255]|nr:hypothetical protein F5Y16DRAFT_398621 [Xylariaceae sp. FL0255]
MLGQYMAYKDSIYQSLLAPDVDMDDEMVQDAMAIVLFPPRNDKMSGSIPHWFHWVQWRRRSFGNPLEGKAPADPILPSFFANTIYQRHIDDRIRKLYNQILVLIEDYVTKAVAACPSTEYLCVPNTYGHLTFKGQTVRTKVSATTLRPAERRRLLKAFLRYDLASKFCYFNSDFSWCRRPFELVSGLQTHEREAVSCVQFYVESLYRALIAQYGCSDSLPEDPALILAVHVPVITDDGVMADGRSTSAIDDSRWTTPLNTDELARFLACFGLDMASTLIEVTTTGQHARNYVGKWLKDLSEQALWLGFKRQNFELFNPITIRVGIFPHSAVIDKFYPNGPGLYQTLYPRIAGKTAQDQTIQLEIYRTRAWVIFDDARLYRSPSGDGPRFPAEDVFFPRIQLDDVVGPQFEVNSNPPSEYFSPEDEIRKLASLLKN